MITTNNAIRKSVSTEAKCFAAAGQCQIAERFLNLLRTAVLQARCAGVDEDFSISGEVELPGCIYSGQLGFMTDRCGCYLFASGDAERSVLASLDFEPAAREIGR